MSTPDRSAASRPRKTLDDFTRELRERQETHRAKLLAREDAHSVWTRLHKPAYDAIYQRHWRRKRHRARLAEEVRLAERRAAEYAAAVAQAEGELAALIREQQDDGNHVRRPPIFVNVTEHFRASQLGLVP